MKNILVIGATGQIGSELTLELRKRYGDDHVVAGHNKEHLDKCIEAFIKVGKELGVLK